MSEIVSLNHEVNGIVKVNGEQQEVVAMGLLRQKTSPMFKMYLHRLSRFLESEVKVINQMRADLNTSFWEGRSEDDKTNPDVLKEFSARIREIAETEVDIEPKSFWGNLNMVEVMQNEKDMNSDEYYPVFFNLIGV